MTYSEELDTIQWRKKRCKILQRDDFRCQECGAVQSDDVCLHVHHKYYLFGHKAWEYRDSVLVTLCEDCHQSFHENNEVPVYVYRNGKRINMDYTPCTRCNGVGYFREFKHIKNGVCFRCNGARYEELIELNDVHIQDDKGVHENVQSHSESILNISGERALPLQPTPVMKKNYTPLKGVSTQKSKERIQSMDLSDTDDYRLCYIPQDKKDDLESINKTQAIKDLQELEKSIKNSMQAGQQKQEEADKRFWIGLAVFLGITTLLVLILFAVNG